MIKPNPQPNLSDGAPWFLNPPKKMVESRKSHAIPQPVRDTDAAVVNQDKKKLQNAKGKKKEKNVNRLYP